jgi:hypothetical protein
MPLGLAVVGAAAVGGTILQANAAKSAANAQAQGNQAAIDEQRRQFDIIQGRLDPYYNVGKQALNTLGGVYGYGSSAQQQQPLSYADWSKQNGGAPTGMGGGGYGLSGGALGNYMGYQNYVKNFQPTAASGGGMAGPDYSSFYQSPDYNFRRTEGTRGIEQSAAARGGAFSGNALKALNQYNSNLAAGEFGNWWNRQAGLAGIGQNATNTLANAGQASATNIGNAMIGQGDARASGIVGGANAWGNLLGGLAGFGGRSGWFGG